MFKLSKTVNNDNDFNNNEEQVFIASAPVASLLGPDLKLKTTKFLVENLLHFKELLLPPIKRDLKIDNVVWRGKIEFEIKKNLNLLKFIHKNRTRPT